jgi:hypothetical protein
MHVSTYVSHLDVLKVDRVLHRVGGWRRTAYRKALAPTSRLPRVVRLALSSSLPPLPFPSLHLAMAVSARPDLHTDEGWAMGVGQGSCMRRAQARELGTDAASEAGWALGGGGCVSRVFYSSARCGLERGVDADEWEPRPNAA